MYGELSKRESRNKAIRAIILIAFVVAVPAMLMYFAGQNCIEYNESRGAKDVWNWSLILIAIFAALSLFWAHIIYSSSKEEIRKLRDELKKWRKKDGNLSHQSIRVSEQYQQPSDEQVANYLDRQEAIYAVIEDMVLYFWQKMSSINQPGLNTEVAKTLGFGPNPGWWMPKSSADHYAYIDTNGEWGYGGTYRIAKATSMPKWCRWSCGTDNANFLVTTVTEVAANVEVEMIYDAQLGGCYESKSNNATSTQTYIAVRKLIVGLLKSHAPNAIDDLPRL
ncbi:MAG: hypothetical protein PVI21_02785 [Candidatus Woesebacteria bacterium]